MNKQEFLVDLEFKLKGAGVPNAENLIEYYDEMISDRIEDGMTEEAAVASMESIESIVANASLEKSIPTLMKEIFTESHRKAKKKGNGGLWIALAIIGSPFWFPILLAGVSVLLALYISIWAVVISLYAVNISFGIVAVAALVGAVTGGLGTLTLLGSFMMAGLALFFAGLTVVLWEPLKLLGKGLVNMIGLLFRKVKKSLL